MHDTYLPWQQVPLVYSNPELWPRPVVTNAIVSHLDFVPTMASLLGLPSGVSKVQPYIYDSCHHPRFPILILTFQSEQNRWLAGQVWTILQL